MDFEDLGSYQSPNNESSSYSLLSSIQGISVTHTVTYIVQEKEGQ